MRRILYFALNDARILYKGRDYKEFQEAVSANREKDGLTTYVLERRYNNLTITRQVLGKEKSSLEGKSADNTLEGVSIFNEDIIYALRDLI